MTVSYHSPMSSYWDISNYWRQESINQVYPYFSAANTPPLTHLSTRSARCSAKLPLSSPPPPAPIKSYVSDNCIPISIRTEINPEFLFLRVHINTTRYSPIQPWYDYSLCPPQILLYSRKYQQKTPSHSYILRNHNF